MSIACPGFDNVFNKYKVSSLIAIPINGDWFVSKHIADKYRKRSLVGIRETLPWAIDIEHAKRGDVKGVY